MANIKVPSERHFKYHRRQYALYLLGCGLMAVGTVIALLMPEPNPALVLVPTGTVFGMMYAIHLVVRARNRAEYREERERLERDEWLASSRTRAARAALVTVIFAQPPMMFFMAYLPVEPSVESGVLGMGLMTTALACGVFSAAYLVRSSAAADE